MTTLTNSSGSYDSIDTLNLASFSCFLGINKFILIVSTFLFLIYIFNRFSSFCNHFVHPEEMTPHTRELTLEISEYSDDSSSDIGEF